MAGKVYLIGAGPGDYKLLTLKALECLEKAEVLVYDRLANPDYLKLVTKDCELIDAGKASSNHTLPQDDINAVIAKKAQEGKVVVRLKGGDPYVFGRGGEEGEYLYDLGIEFEVVPGITSAIGGLCYAGIPITHRDYASSFHVITGHLKDETQDETNWAALAGVKGTLVFLMGVANLKKITTKLMENGKSKETPVALISWATRFNQSVLTGTLEDICEKASEVKPPTLIVVGEVVKLREKLNFFENKPLFGKRIVVTRTRAQSSELVAQIRANGGLPMECPTISTEAIANNELLKKALNELERYSHIIFTSQNAVQIFMEGLFEAGLDARSLQGKKLIAMGNATHKSLMQRGLRADFMPTKAVAECLCEELKPQLTETDCILLPHSAMARECLAVELSKVCKVDEIAIYENKLPEEAKAHQTELIELLQQGKVDYITFTSSSTVKHFIELLGIENIDLLKQTQLVSIGEITSKTIRSFGLEVAKEAKEANMSAMLDCLMA